MHTKNVFSTTDMEIDYILGSIPGYVYWKNLDSVYIGCNKNFATLIGLNDPSEIIGMAEHQMPWAITRPETVEHNMRTDRYVIETGDTIVTEEDVAIKNEERLSVILRSEKRPLINKKGGIIGVLGISVNITDAKEAERLKLENLIQVHRAELKQQEKFQKIIEQVVHDLGSPLLAMQIILPQCDTLPEDKRDILRTAAARIYDISSNLLSRFKPNQNEDTNETKHSRTLINNDISEIFAQKRYE